MPKKAAHDDHAARAAIRVIFAIALAARCGAARVAAIHTGPPVFVGGELFPGEACGRDGLNLQPDAMLGREGASPPFLLSACRVGRRALCHLTERRSL